MAFPWVFEENFEAGTKGTFDGTTVNGDSKLFFANYKDLQKFPGVAMPFNGAYCLQSNLSLGTSAAYVKEDTTFDMTAGTNELYLRFMLWVDPNLTMATTNEFAIMQYWSSTNTVEAGVYINYTTANGYRIGIGEASASSFLDLPLGKWVSVETFFDPAGSSASTLDMWVDDGPATQVASFTSANITSGILGTTGIDAGTTKGHILFDQVIADDARIYRPKYRFREIVNLTQSGHAFVGPGSIDDITLNAGGASDNIILVYDTDEADVLDYFSTVARLENTATEETVNVSAMPVNVRNGCYVSLAGTNPKVTVKIRHATAYGSDGAIRSYAGRQ